MRFQAAAPDQMPARPVRKEIAFRAQTHSIVRPFARSEIGWVNGLRDRLRPASTAAPHRLSVDIPVTSRAQGNEILIAIIALLAAESSVMDFETHPRTARLTTPRQRGGQMPPFRPLISSINAAIRPIRTQAQIPCRTSYVCYNSTTSVLQEEIVWRAS